MNIDHQLIAELKPDFTAKELEQMKLYFEASQACSQELNNWLQEELKDHPVFGPFMVQQTTQMLEQRNQLSLELTRRALYQGEWEPYINDLIVQGVAYAKLGLEFREWFNVVSKAKDFLFPRILSYYQGDTAKVFGAMNGLSKLTDFAMQSIAEAYFIETRNSDQTQKKKQAALIKELESFAYVVSHDLKSPLRGIAKISEWMEVDYADKLDDNGRNQLNMLRSRVHRLDNLIEGILEYSRLGRYKGDEKPIDLNEVVREIVDLNANLRSVNIRIAPNLPTIRFVRPKIDQIFSNLVSNAIKYNDKRKIEIEIGYEELPKAHRFWVKDNGPGIEPQYHERVFGIFQTLQTKDEVESTGIGLSIVQKIVHDAEGDIWIESEMGESTSFIFTLPRV